MENQLPFQVKYTIRFSNGTPEKDGLFAFASDNPADPAILKNIVDREPGLNSVDYILGRILPIEEPDSKQGKPIKTNPIFSFSRTEIRQYLETH